jgi:hypothetical protein
MEHWCKAVEETSDVIGEMMVENAEGKQTYTYEQVAAAALKAGIIALLDEEPGRSRIEEAAKIIYEKLHNPKDHEWTSLGQTETVFWKKVSHAAMLASDRQLKNEIENVSLSEVDSI